MTNTETSVSQTEYTWEGYKKEFFPSRVEQEVAEATTPFELGTRLAGKALEDLRSTLAHFIPPVKS